VIVELEDEKGTVEANPSNYHLSTLNFAFLWTGYELIVMFDSLEGKVSFSIGKNVKGNLTYIETHGVEYRLRSLPFGRGCVGSSEKLKKLRFRFLSN